MEILESFHFSELKFTGVDCCSSHEKGGTEVAAKYWEGEEMSLKCSIRPGFCTFLGREVAVNTDFCISLV